MNEQSSLEKQEPRVDNKEASKLESILKHGETLSTRLEQQNSHISIDREALPQEVDKSSIDKKLTRMQKIQQEVREATLAASLLIFTSNAAFAESTPKDFEQAPQTQSQPESSPSPIYSAEQTNATLEIIKGVATIALEQKKKDVQEVFQGVDTAGKEVATRDRIGKAAEMVPKDIPKLGNIASVLSAAIDIQKKIAEAKPGANAEVFKRVIRLVADIKTAGLTSLALNWLLSSKEAEKKTEPAVAVNEPLQHVELPVETPKPLPENLPLEGDGGESNPEESSPDDTHITTHEKEVPKKVTIE